MPRFLVKLKASQPLEAEVELEAANLHEAWERVGVSGFGADAVWSPLDFEQNVNVTDIREVKS